MSKIDEMLKQMCPDGVEYKRLKEVSVMERGTSATKNTLVTGEIPVVSGGKEPSFYCDRSNRDGETITIAGSGAGAGFIRYWDCPIFVNDAFSIKGCNVISTKFLYYYLSSLQDKIYATKTGGGIPHVRIANVENFMIPLPPLEIQKEIVKVLDVFTKYDTELQAELQAELQDRIKQYEYYRDKLLNFDDAKHTIRWTTLGEVCKIKNGKDYKALGEGEIPVYGSGGVMTYVDTFAYDKPSVLIPRKGSLSNLYYVTTPFWNVDTIFYTEIDESQVRPKYLFYVLQREHLENLNKASGVPSLTQEVLNRVKIAIPPLKIQSNIVSILDNFDKICSDLKTGLPAEIEKRQKQYEYYRDKLLTFQPKS